MIIFDGCGDFMEIQKNSVTQFDNKLVDVFMKIESIVKNIN
jgi:hypothetical protein